MDAQKVVLVLIIAVLLVGLAFELKYIEDMFSMSGLSAEDQCRVMCSERGKIPYFVKQSCYCKEPIKFEKNWRCFWNVTFHEGSIFSEKFNSSSVRNQAVRSVVKYPAPNSPATKVFGIFNEVSNRIYYVSDPVKDEYIAGPLETWDAMGGDCDDFSILLASMYESVGLDAKIVDVYNIDGGHVFLIVEIAHDLESFAEQYKSVLERYTPYFGFKEFNFIVTRDNQRGCEQAETGLEAGENVDSFYVIVETTAGDYPGSVDAFEGYENVKFIEVGEWAG